MWPMMSDVVKDFFLAKVAEGSQGKVNFKTFRKKVI